jgi:hypothetical protein
MKITKSRLKELIKEVLKENEPFKDRPFDYSSLMRDEDNPFSPEGQEKNRALPIEIQGPAVISVQYEGGEHVTQRTVEKGESYDIIKRA